MLGLRSVALRRGGGDVAGARNGVARAETATSSGMQRGAQSYRLSAIDYVDSRLGSGN